MSHRPSAANHPRYSRPRLLPFLPPLAAVLFSALITCCSQNPPPKPSAGPTSQPAPQLDVLWTLHSARRQTSFVKLDLPVIVSGMRITISTPTGPSTWINPANSPDALTLFSTHIARGNISGPAVEQLTGFPQTSSDAGSHLVKLPIENPPSKDAPDKTYLVTDPFPLYLQVEVSSLQDPGDYTVPITISIPNRASGPALQQAALAIHVSDIALPTDPRILAVATTTTADLVRLLPDSFASINAVYLDRADVDSQLAVRQLDALVKAAQKQNLALFVEDIAPRLRVDEVGRISLDWNAYDRLMQPYMDGSAFDDRVPLPVWLAPLPPRRISDSPTQLRQYIAACAQHFTDKAWTATPAFLHPALLSAAGEGEGGGRGDPQLRDDVAKTLRLHMTRDMLAVTSPDAPVPQPRLWTIDDSDPRLPPAGSLATEHSVRLWPWVCAARSAATKENSQPVRGFVWRNALERSDILGLPSADTTSENPVRPLLVINPVSKAAPEKLTILPSLRMVWLSEGLNDTAMLGLLEQRTDPSILNELFAGIVGRTGLPASATAPSEIPLPAPGYLYAGWPEDNATWDSLPAMLEKIAAAGTPGQRSQLSDDDPLYMATKLWLAKSRRPVARIAGYQFSIRPGRDGDALIVTPHLLAENPVDASVQMDARFSLLPGDLDLLSEKSARADRRSFDAPPLGIAQIPLSLAGFIDSLDRTPSAPSLLEITERHGGALLQLPVQLPLYRMHPTATPLQITAHPDDWPNDTTLPAFGQMQIATRYLSRPDLLAGAIRNDLQPATARWTYDQNFLYTLIHSPQPIVSDERNNDWPTQLGRWWGTDGIQLQLADAADSFPKTIIHLAFKPGGPMLARTLTFSPNHSLQFSDTLPPNPAAGGIKYAITLDKSDGKITGYTLEVAIPRAWFPTAPGTSPAWRVNILRHRADTLTSTSWSGPLVNDHDLAPMGLLIGKE